MARYSSGKGKTRFQSDRSGFTFPYLEGVIEPGTGLFVHKSENDGMWSLAKHPQNFPPKLKPEAIGLRNARPQTGAYKDSYWTEDSDNVSPPNINEPLSFDIPVTNEDGGIIIIEGYGP